jgi:hypothetical protein
MVHLPSLSFFMCAMYVPKSQPAGAPTSKSEFIVKLAAASTQASMLGVGPDSTGSGTSKSLHLLVGDKDAGTGAGDTVPVDAGARDDAGKLFGTFSTSTCSLDKILG